MSMVETVVLREPWDVDRRLAELALDRNRLLKVAAVAISAGADATPFHPANAAGTFSYQHGTWALRDEFVGDVWVLDRLDGVEAISNDSIKVKVVFANVDVACVDLPEPKPRSRKGAGTERACSGNLFGSLPHFALRQSEEWMTYYLMVDEVGVTELSRPVIKNNTFHSYIERLYLFDCTGHDPVGFPLGDDGVADGFDPHVARR